MEIHEILALYDDQERKNSTHPQYERVVAGPVVRHVSRNPSRLSFILYSDLADANIDQVIQDQIDWYREEVDGYGLEWKTFQHDEPPDLGARLQAHGFEGDEVEGLLVIDLENCPAVFLEPVTADVRRVDGVAGIELVAHIQEEVYDKKFDWLVDQLKENTSKEPDFWGIYVAYIEGQLACAGWISFPKNSTFAGLWGGATLPQYRKMGLYTALVAARAQEAIRRGYRFLTVDAGPMSKPILLKHGFRLLTNTTPYLWSVKK